MPSERGGLWADQVLWLFWVHIRCCGNGFLWFRPYGDSLWQTPQRKQRSGPRRSAPRWGSGFLRSGIHPGASPPVCFAAPPLDACGFAARSLRSHPRMNPSTQPSEGAGTSRAVLELTLIVFDRSHAPRGNAAGDAPRPILECLKVVSVSAILPTRFSGCPSEARALACFGRCQFSDRAWKPA
ncbi:UNVERIFIED_ORG: hypothetical protein J2X80_004429 [Pseudomonas fluorescens]|nr:hypothetical protein [Pseudomonas fluorescens]